MILTTFDELRDAWPKDDIGRECVNLVVSYLQERLIQTAVKNDANPVSAPAEAAADKVFAALIVDFRTIIIPRAERRSGPVLAPLRRFQQNPEDPEKPANEKANPS